MATGEQSNKRNKQLMWQLTACGLLGLALVMLPHAFGTYATLVRETVAEIGKALIVAAVLGLGVDLALKQDLVRDAVEASIGYLLPPQLRNEMEWVFGQEVIAEQTYHVTLVHFPEKRMVVVKGTYDRVIRNITRQSTKVRVAGGTDEWFNPNASARITTAEYRYYRDQKYQNPIKLPIEITRAGVKYGTEEKVDLRPDELIHVSVAYELPCPEHAMESLTYRYPIENPKVEVEVPETLRAHINIRHREPAHSYKEWGSGFLTARLNGTLLPHQDIYILWHRADDLAGRPDA